MICVHLYHHHTGRMTPPDRKLCGEEAEVHAQLSPEAMGIQAMAQSAS